MGNSTIVQRSCIARCLQGAGGFLLNILNRTAQRQEGPHGGFQNKNCSGTL